MRGFVLWLGCLFMPAAMSQAPAQRIEGPAVKAGDVWIYNTLEGWNNVLEDVSVVRVKRVGPEGILMEATGLDGSNLARIERTAGFNLIRIQAPKLTRATLPYYPSYSFPLWVGKTWRGKVSFESTDQPGKEVLAELEARVLGFESVTVPAGTFFALKIELGGPYRAKNIEGSWSGRIEDTLWYAPEVRNAVRYEYKDTVDNALYNHEIHELVRYWLVP